MQENERTRRLVEEMQRDYPKGLRVTLKDSELIGTIRGVDESGNVQIQWDGTAYVNAIYEGNMKNIEPLGEYDYLFRQGDVVAHFKRGALSDEYLKRNPNKHLYRIVASSVINTETNEFMVIYQALYSPFLIFARPMDMATEKVDWNKYPDIPYEKRQAYRLMRFPEEELAALDPGEIF